MKTIYAFFKLETRRLLCKRNVVIFLLFLVICLYFVHMGSERYKHIQETKEKFLKSEQMKVRSFVTYRQYGNYGFRLLFVPSPLNSLFYNSSPFSVLTSFIDSGARLRIYNTFLGKNLFNGNQGGFGDFSGVLFLIGSLFSLYLGYEALFHKEYLKFLGSFIDHYRVYIAIIVSRIVIIMTFFLFTIGCGLLVLNVKDISLSSEDYVNLGVFSLVAVLTQIFFFAAGTAVSSIKSRSSGIAMIFVIWFVFIFVVPVVVQAIVSERSHNISSNYTLEQEKLKKLMGFEKMAIQKGGEFKNLNRKSPVTRKLLEKYWDKDFQTIKKLNKKMENEMKENIRSYQWTSILFPSTFYLSVNNEISSNGYGSFLGFYEYIQKTKEGFVRFFFDKLLYSNDTKVESFIKNDENVFYSRSLLPGNFLQGIMVIGLYTFVFFGFSFYRYNKSLFQVSDFGVTTSRACDLLDIPISQGEYNFVKIYDNKIFPRFFILLSGKESQFKGKVNANGEPLSTGRREDFIYVCRADHIPGEIGTRTLMFFLKALARDTAVSSQCMFQQMKEKFHADGLMEKRFHAMENHEKGKVMLTLLKLLLTKNRICLFHNFETGMPSEFNRYMEGEINTMKGEGASILHFSSDAFFIPGNADRYSTILNKNGELIYKEMNM